MVAALDGERVESWALDDAAWRALQQSYRVRDLRMTCGELAVPKISPRGLRFFAHHPSRDCGLHLSGPESAEHHEAKRLLADAARAAGWEATVEAIAPDRSWIADVLIERGEARVALEVQWALQPDAVFDTRAERYRASGLRCAWFVGPRNHGRGVGRTYELDGEAGALSMKVPGKLGAEPDRVGIREGARRLFAGEIAYTAEMRSTAADIEYFMMKCFREECRAWYSRWYIAALDATSRCGQRVRVQLDATGHGLLTTGTGLELDSAGRGDGRGPVWGSFAVSRPEANAQDQLIPMLAEQDMPKPCAYGRRRSRDVPEGYIAALCPKCGTMQGDAFLVLDQPRTRTVSVPWRTAVTLGARHDGVRHWCQDVGHGRCSGEVRGVFPAPYQTAYVDAV